jgi:uncharacterized membrane protein
MKEKGKTIAGILIVLVGVLELVVGIYEGTLSAILFGSCFCVMGCLYFFKKENKDYDKIPIEKKL